MKQYRQFHHWQQLDHRYLPVDKNNRYKKFINTFSNYFAPWQRKFRFHEKKALVEIMMEVCLKVQQFVIFFFRQYFHVCVDVYAVFRTLDKT